MQDRLITLAEFHNAVEAQIAADTLKMHGIESQISDAHLAHVIHLLSTVKLMVSEREYARASQVLKEAHQKNDPNSQSSEVYPKRIRRRRMVGKLILVSIFVVPMVVVLLLFIVR